MGNETDMVPAFRELNSSRETSNKSRAVGSGCVIEKKLGEGMEAAEGCGSHGNWGVREGPSEGRCHLSKRPARIEGQSCEVLWGSIPVGRRVLRQRLRLEAQQEG